jgi:hypothetical protein
VYKSNPAVLGQANNNAASYSNPAHLKRQPCIALIFLPHRKERQQSIAPVHATAQPAASNAFKVHHEHKRSTSHASRKTGVPSRAYRSGNGVTPTMCTHVRKKHIAISRRYILSPVSSRLVLLRLSTGRMDCTHWANQSLQCIELGNNDAFTKPSALQTSA